MKKIILAALLCCCPLFAAAQSKPIDFTQVLTDLDGSPLHAGDDKSPVLTLGDVVKTVLVSQLDGDPADGSDKLDRYDLAKKVFHGKHVVLSGEQLALIVKRLRRGYPALVVGAALPMLDSLAK